MKSGRNKMTVQAAKELKKMVEDAESAYDDLIQKIAQATGNEGHELLPGARNCAMRAYDCAKKLRNWIRDLAIDSDPIWANLKREDKLLSMPYIVVLSFAVRIMADACMLMGYESENEASRMPELVECRRIIDEFLGVACTAVTRIVCNSDLLEVALDYYLPLAAYMMLSIGIKATDPIKLGPEMIAAAKKQGLSAELSNIRWGRIERNDDDDEEESQAHITIRHSHT